MRRISPFIETRSIYIRRRLSKGQSAPNLFRVTECGQLAHLTLYRDLEYIHTPSTLKRAISSESFPRYEVWMYVRKICGASHPLSRLGVYTYAVVSQKGNLFRIFSALRNVDSWRISPFIETRSICIRRRFSKEQSAPNLFHIAEGVYCEFHFFLRMGYAHAAFRKR